MTFNIRTKLLVYFIVLEIFTIILTAFSVYEVSSRSYYIKLLKNTFSIARVTADIIDSDLHSNFKDITSIHDPKYVEYRKILNSFHGAVSYLFTIKYDNSKEKFYYVLDSNVVDRETLAFDSEEISFELRINPKGNLEIIYNSNNYDEDFEIEKDDKFYKIEFKDYKNRRGVFLNGQPLFSLVNPFPMRIEHRGNIIVSNYEPFKGNININNINFNYLIYMVPEKGSMASPGVEVVTNPDQILLYKELMRTGKDHEGKRVHRTSYGEFIISCAVIKDKNGKATGIVEVDTSIIELKKFRMEILKMTSYTAIAVFLITTVLVLFVTKYFTKPIHELMKGVHEISEGNFNTSLQLSSTDEFGQLAGKFNQMVKLLGESYQESSRLNVELKNLNHSLEEKIMERTSELEEAKDISDAALWELKKRTEQIEKELDQARKIQSNLLPQKIPESDFLHFHTLYQPIDKVGGDLYGFVEFDNKDIGVFIADVAGHGIPAAFIASMIKQEFDSVARFISSPAETLQHINYSILNKIGGRFVTIFYLILKSNGEFTFANGGHLYPIRIDPAAKFLEELQYKGTVVGAFKDAKWADTTLKLKQGERLLLFTDGIVEARGVNEIFGEERLNKAIYENLTLPGRFLIYQVMNDVNAFLKGKKLNDDVTLMVIERD